jgi:two-component system, OmpR family, sensor histidine kinase SenX3
VNPRLLAGSLTVAALAFVLGAGPGGPVALVAALLVAVLAAMLATFLGSRRTRRTADHVHRWLRDVDEGALEVRGDDPAWRELTIVLNALGDAYHRRGARLARERPWRRELVDSLVQPALLFSRKARMLAANDAARTLLAIPPDASDLTPLQALGAGALAAAVREVRRSGRPVTIDTHHAGRELRAVTTMVGEETLVIIEDRTRERRVEELRRNFVVNASHELKTPVTSIQTLAEALAVTVRDDPDRVPALVSRLGAEASRLARLVGDLLDLRRLEERGPLERVPVDLAELVRRVVAEQYDRAEARSVEVSVDAPDRAHVAGIPAELELVVKNLVANAVQYNRAGGTVEVVLRPHEGTHVLVVRDTGIGIPPQDLGRVFERFYRVDSGRSRETGGTGLGLSIVRHAVERHGGELQVDSRIGEGTTFTVTLPVDAEPGGGSR